jgi:hypothetical protein
VIHLVRAATSLREWASLDLTDYPQVDVLGVRYNPVNFAEENSPDRQKLPEMLTNILTLTASDVSSGDEGSGFSKLVTFHRALGPVYRDPKRLMEKKKKFRDTWEGLGSGCTV